MQGLLASSSGGIGVISSILNTTSSSIKALIPGASAAGNGVDVQEAWEYTQENCPDQAAAGFIVDPASAICSTIVASYDYTLDSDPGENIYYASKADSGKNFDDDGDSESDLPPIAEGGDYAEFLEACTMSDVEPGVPDYNLKSSYEKATTGNTFGDAALGMVPFVGSAMSFFNSEKVISHSSYISKEACRTDYDPAVDEVEIPSAQDRKVYTAIYPQSRVAVAQGLTDEDVVGDYIKQYYEKNPIDTSFEGLLAHFSGFTKDMVIATLDQMDTLNFLAKYDPSEYGPVEVDDTEQEYKVEEDNSIFDSYIVADSRYIEDKRLKNYAV